MNRNTLYILFCFLSLYLFLFAKKPDFDSVVILDYPEYWPKPAYDFSKTPLEKNKIELGRELFYDPILSLDGTVSCSSCHLSYTAFTHVDHSVSHGINDSIGNRNSPVLINLAWNNSFMWDGAVNNIEVQALAPIEHPAEMGETISNVIYKLQKTKNYPQLFYKAYGDSLITGRHFLKALSQFQLTLVSSNSKYDRMIEGKELFNAQEENGYQLFKQNCAICHTEPLFTNNKFENNGLSIDSNYLDYGRLNITLNPKDSLKFKVPTLRNIEFSFPYMHDGRFESLSEVLKHYNGGIQNHNTLSKNINKSLNLTSNEQVDIVAFLLTLTDKKFLFNPDFSYPK